MEQVLSFIWNYGIMFVVLLTVLVYVHELGHYLVARWCGVRVEVFSIGFGRELFGWTDPKSGTRWKFSAIPLGGYVKMFGEHDLEDGADVDADTEPGAGLTPEEREVSFSTKSVGQRAAIVAAGPIANWLFAVIVLAALFVVVGRPYTAPLITSVVEDSAAARAGFQAGDVVVQIDGNAVERFEDIQIRVLPRPEESIQFVVERDGVQVSLTAVPARVVDERDGTERGQLGVQGGQRAYVNLGPIGAITTATTDSVALMGQMLTGLGQVITGQRSVDELGGPVRIAQITGDVAQRDLNGLIYFAALLSINLALINLFPIPMLDGGHLVFYAAEALRGRPIGARAQEMSFRVGLALLLTLIILFTINDIRRLPIIDYVAGLIG